MGDTVERSVTKTFYKFGGVAVTLASADVHPWEVRMAVKEEPVKSFQGYSIIKITETDDGGNLVIETFALAHGAGGVIAEYGLMNDAVSELNRLLFPLRGLPTGPTEKTR